MAQRCWWQDAVVYQIYPRSFADGDGDGIGDLAGLVRRLDYLRPPGEPWPDTPTLGVDAIWLTPFYPSPLADFGYDVADYTDVDPTFGTLEDFKALIEEAHRRSLRVIIDWVPSHTSTEHPWFREASSSRDNPKRDWYVWRDGKADGAPPNNWMSAFAKVGPAWTFHEPTRQWYLHSYRPEQADLNWENPEVERTMHDVLRFWLDLGVDGFRVDAIHRLGKDPALRDNPEIIVVPTPGTAGRRYDEDRPNVHGRVRAIRKVIDEYPDRMLVGETYVLDQRRLGAYLNPGEGVHLAHNFVFVHQPWSAAAIRGVVDGFEALIAPGVWPAWFFSNHDHPRLATRYDEGGQGAARARVAALLLLTLRGTPFLYQGEELGLPDTTVPPDAIVDVDGRDPARTPLPWEPPSSVGPGAGFTTGNPWLPMTDQAETINVHSQASDPRSMLSLYRRLLRLRLTMPALRSGDYRSLDTGETVYTYLRATDDQRFLVALNFTSAPVQVDAAASVEGRSARLELSTDPDREAGAELHLSALALGPDEGLLIRLS
ncbi:MAG: DUF3459 domain-containing protein [Nitriliruptorales bacterium]|nr:DUF3459 domain-containing protein [Nitriliruptorales bacterium]